MGSEGRAVVLRQLKIDNGKLRMKVGQTGWLLNNAVCPTEFIYICFLLCKGQGQRDVASNPAT